MRRNLVHFRTCTHDFVLILSGDQLYRMDFREIIAQHMATGSGSDGGGPSLPDLESRGHGIDAGATMTSTIEEFVEKPKDPADHRRPGDEPGLGKRHPPAALPKQKRCLASMGIYVFNRAGLAEALDNAMTDFGKEVMPSLLKNKKIYAYIFEGYWEDIGTVRAFFEANLALAQPLPPFNFFEPNAPIYTQDRYLPASKLNRCHIDHVVIGDGSILTDSSLKRCVLGIRSFIGEGSRLEDVVMMGADFYRDGGGVGGRAAPTPGGPGWGSGALARSPIPSSTRMPGSATGASYRPRAKPTAATPMARS